MAAAFTYEKRRPHTPGSITASTPAQLESRHFNDLLLGYHCTNAAPPVDRFHKANRIGRMELKPADLILRRREAPSRRGWPMPRSRLWPSFEARAILRGARSSGRG